MIFMLVLAFVVGVAVGSAAVTLSRPESPKFQVGYDVIRGHVRVLARVRGHVGSEVVIAAIDPAADDFDGELAEALAEARSRASALSAGLR